MKIAGQFRLLLVLFPVFLLVLPLPGACSGGDRGFPGFEAEVYSLSDPAGAQDREGVRRLYREWYGLGSAVDSLGSLSTGEADEVLYEILMATELVAAMAPFPGLLQHASAALYALEERDLAARPHYVSYYRTSVLLRRFDEAERVYMHIDGSYPRVRVVDGGDVVGPRSLLRPAGDGISYDYERVPAIPLAAGVIVVGHDDCSWTQRALSDISGDREVSDFFSRKSVNIAPHNTIFQPVPAGARSNFSIVWDPGEWPEVDNWSVPNFYFFRGGRVVHVVRGWSGEEQLEEVRAGIAKVGGRPSPDHAMRNSQ